jgi:multicomponent Na+:H+ antiporter subunit B
VIGRHESEIVRVVGYMLAPFILIFGLYVIAHGHYGPGGGFAGGVILAVSLILLRITAHVSESRSRFSPRTAAVTMLLGMLVFVLTGLAPVLSGGEFLDYAAVELGVDAARTRYLGILVVEVAIGFAVFGALVWMFDELIERGRW